MLNSVEGLYLNSPQNLHAKTPFTIRHPTNTDNFHANRVHLIKLLAVLLANPPPPVRVQFK